MILKDHPIRYTAIQVRRSIDRLETFKEMNPADAGKYGTQNLIDHLKNLYQLFPRELRK